VAPPITCSVAYGSQDWADALARCRAEAAAGDALAGRLAATMLAQGLGTPADQDSAARYFAMAAEAGDPLAQFEMGRRYERRDGGVSRDPTRATEMYLEAANAGHRPAFAIVARRIDQGLGVPRNDVDAATWYARAAREANDAPSQFALGRMYAAGRGVRKDEAEAVRLFTSAAAVNTDARYELGMAYLRGRGVARSDSLGLVWLERAARDGHADAERELARRRG
jgi:TPR repeat protein